MPLTQLMATLKAACPAADTYTPPDPAAATSTAGAAGSSTNGSTNGTKKSGGSSGSGGGGSAGSNVYSLAATNKMLDSFPGPLSGSSVKDRVVKFVKDRLAAFPQDEGLRDAPAWQVGDVT